MGDECCPYCEKEIVDTWEFFTDTASHEIAKFPCPHCEKEIVGWIESSYSLHQE